MILKSSSAKREASTSGIRRTGLLMFGALLVICPFIPYSIVEANTFLHSQEFYAAIATDEVAGHRNPIYMLKVLRYTLSLLVMTKVKIL
jgi:hypothetical protein